VLILKYTGMPIAPNTMRLGKKYRCTNYSHTTEFEVLEALEKENFKVKDINVLEVFEFQDLIRYGIGEDYDLMELE
jgi:hypothetical protein